jgi:hypothetical protein
VSYAVAFVDHAERCIRVEGIADRGSMVVQTVRADFRCVDDNIFDLIYKGDGGGIVVSAARADRSPRPHDHE